MSSIQLCVQDLNKVFKNVFQFAHLNEETSTGFCARTGTFHSMHASLIRKKTYGVLWVYSQILHTHHLHLQAKQIHTALSHLDHKTGAVYWLQHHFQHHYLIQGYHAALGSMHLCLLIVASWTSWRADPRWCGLALHHLHWCSAPVAPRDVHSAPCCAHTQLQHHC